VEQTGAKVAVGDIHMTPQVTQFLVVSLQMREIVQEQ
jgi:hypothetical protein